MVTTTLPRGVIGESYSYALLASGGLRPYSWSVIGGALASGLSLGADGTLSGKPAAAGVFSFDVQVTDGRLGVVARTLSLAIADAPGGLAILPPNPPDGVSGVNYTHTFRVNGGVPPYGWSGVVPEFLTLDATSGRLYGMPLTQGSYTFTVMVKDAVGGTATATYSIVIRRGPPALTVTTAVILDATAGTFYTQAFGASGGTPPYKWSIQFGNVDNLTLNTQSGELQGTPEQAGTFPFLLQVTDSAGASASQQYTLIVNSPTLTITITGSLPAGTVGTAYSQRLPMAVGGGRTPYTWSIGAGLPSGLMFTPEDQNISGKPTAAGKFSFSVQITDAGGVSATRQLSMVVNSGALAFVTAQRLPDGTLNEPYAAAVEANGGQPPYRWSSSGLPAGLTINSATGQISGTPLRAGEFPIAITVLDSALVNIADRFTLSVKLPALPRVTLSGLPATARAAEQFQVAVTLDAPYAAPIAGEAILTFTPDSGAPDRTVQFASGGRSAQISIPAGSTTAVSTVPLAVQTGTVAGTITVSLLLQAGGVDVGQTPTLTARIERGEPVIASAKVSRSGGGFTVTVSGYSTAREVTQAVFTFKASAGQSLASSSIAVPVDGLFGPWFQDAANSEYGSQFVYTQPFTVQGDANAIVPETVTLTNRVGSATFTIAAN